MTLPDLDPPEDASRAELERLERELDPFLRANTSAALAWSDGEPLIVTPWGDPSLQIVLREAGPALLGALNSVVLPPRFTAIWHSPARAFEFIWGPVTQTSDEIGRSFEFRFEGLPLTCRFGEASAALTEIALATRITNVPSGSGYRNLPTVRRYLRFRDSDQRIVENTTLASFWVSPLPMDEDLVASVARHLNLCMFRFDRQTPRVIVHEPRTETTPARGARYPMGSFPPAMASGSLDPYILELWDAAVAAPDALRRFLSFYQVIEYAAFYLVEEDTIREVRRALLSPEVPARAADFARRIVELVASDRRTEEAKLVAVVQRCVDPAVLWGEIEPNRDYFSREVRFDGGLAVPPLLREGWGLDDFRAVWIPRLPDTLRKIRNALVHSREPRMAGVIAHTRANLGRLSPWARLLAVVATETALFGSCS